MTGRSWMAGLLLVAAGTAASTVASAQTRQDPVRWNDRAARIDADESPTVSLWFEGPAAFAYGAPVRVWFNVSEDAHVIVARVDANGHLTLLHPTNRTQRTLVSGQRDVLVRGRRGVASFYATDRLGGGFVFAMASYDPFDLSRLGLRDFDRYVTGMYVGRPTEVYVGDPHRVVERFANMVSFSDASPYDYAVDFYNVDAPYYMTSAGYSRFCNGFSGGYGGAYRGADHGSMQERWDDEFYYGSSVGMGMGNNCVPFSQCNLLGLSGFGFGYSSGTLGLADPYCDLQRRGAIGNLPIQPPQGPDSLRVPPSLADEIGGQTPDTVGSIPVERPDKSGDGPNALRRARTGTEATRSPIAIAADDPTDRSYAIPGRALRNARSTIGQTRDLDRSPIAGGIDRRGPNSGRVDWVRPPRDVVEGPRRDLGDGVLPRSPRDRAERPDRSARDSDGPRGGRPTFVNPSDGRGDISAPPPRFDPPSRGAGPRFDAPSPNVRSNGDGPRMYTPPPPRNDSPRMDSPRSNPSPGSEIRGQDRGANPGAAPARAADPPRAAPAPGASASAAGSEKKSDSKQP